MRKANQYIAVGLTAIGLTASIAFAQGPGPSLSRSADAENLVERMSAFDKNGDGALPRSEVTDQRLLRLFDRADAGMNGKVTKEELTALTTKEHSDQPDFFGGFGGPPGGPGGPPPGFTGGMPRPGEILPPMLRRDLKLTPEQTQALEKLQREVDQSLDTILTDAQKKQLKEIGSRGPRVRSSERRSARTGRPRSASWRTALNDRARRSGARRDLGAARAGRVPQPICGSARGSDVLGGRRDATCRTSRPNRTRSARTSGRPNRRRLIEQDSERRAGGGSWPGRSRRAVRGDSQAGGWPRGHSAARPGPGRPT